MLTRNVVITDHQAELVEQLVNNGRFQNVSELLRYGLRLVEQREAIALADADIAAGRYVTIETDEDLDAFLASLDTE